ncbi:MAG: hypothetical protein ACREN8_10735, partial [Candidatus Dormibacteraceae bacterium]
MSASIKQYIGKKGLKEITEHSLEAAAELWIIETAFASLDLIMSHDEAEAFRKALLDKQIHCRQISNELFRDYTNVPGFHEQVMDIRYIPPQKLKIEREILIYNNVVAFYKTSGNNLFGIEIIDSDFAKQQRQLFEMVWAQADRPPTSVNN